MSAKVIRVRAGDRTATGYDDILIDDDDDDDG